MLVWSQVLERIDHLVRVTVFIVVVLKITKRHHGGVGHAETEATRDHRAVQFIEDSLRKNAFFEMFWSVFMDNPSEFFAKVL